MVKLRAILLITTFLVVGSVGTLVFLYAKGYRLNPKTRQFSPNGLFVAKSHPEAAQVLINGELKTATNTTIPLPPSTYDVTITKEGFLPWNKRLTIEKEVVTEATAHLFKLAASLSPITFSGVVNPLPSPDLSKLAYIVPPQNNNAEVSGLWIIESVNLPLGFARDPRRITDGNLTQSTFVWSPNAREILLTTARGVYLLDIGTFTPQSQRVNVAQQTNQILEKWEEERKKRLEAQMRKLPEEFIDIIERKVSQIVFSPDEDMVTYIASGSATIPNELIKPVPGASSQKQERDIKEGRTYVYDIKEDRNFLISEEEVTPYGWVDYRTLAETENLKTSSPSAVKIENSKPSLSWYPSSRHLILAEEDRIIIMDYDGTNRQTVYSGSYVAPHAYPTLSLDRLLILTNLGASDTPTNLYSLGIK